MPGGGKVTISGRAMDGSVEISVRDEGVGIPPDMMPRIFTPFFTTKGKDGTGLGLSVTHNIVKTAGGRIEVESWSTKAPPSTSGCAT